MVSIVTINLNNKSGLIKTIESVLSQTCSDVEFIVIDGGSSDGSKDVLINYSDHLSYSISEPDNGIYNAMNKGILKATGSYCLFLNSGDYFYADESLDTLLRNSGDVDLVYGDLMVVSKGHSTRREYPGELSFDFFYRGESLPHAATLIKTSLFVSHGMYEEDFKIVSDWAFFLKAMMDTRVTYRHVNETIVVFDGHGISANKDNSDQMKREREMVLSRYKFFVPDYRHLNDQKKRLLEVERSFLHRVAELINTSWVWNFFKKIKRWFKFMV